MLFFVRDDDSLTVQTGQFNSFFGIDEINIFLHHDASLSESFMQHSANDNDFTKRDGFHDDYSPLCLLHLPSLYN